MAFVPKITVSEFVEREISIRYKRLPIVNFVNLIKSGVELGKFERYVIEFFREVKPENRRKFMVEQNITPFEMEQLYNKVKHIPAVSTVEGSIYGEWTHSYRIAFGKISLSYPEGKIDFVKAFQVSDYLPTLKHVFNQNIFVDDDIEIVTKKVFFRGASLHPRDLYDLATVYLGPRRSELVNALINIPEQLQEFHDALQRVGPGFSFSEDYGLDLVLDIPLGLNGREVDICIDLCNEVRKSLV